MELKIKKLYDDAVLPVRRTAGAACFDLFARPGAGEDVYGITVFEDAYQLVKLGWAMELPPGCCALVRPRSGLAKNNGVTVHPGTIDEDYRGEVGVMVSALRSGEVLPIDQPIAQMLIQRYETPTIVVVDELGETARGGGGYGSTDR